MEFQEGIIAVIISWSQLQTPISRAVLLFDLTTAAPVMCL